MYDQIEITSQFPILNRTSPSGSPLIYLDSAATALKPQCVIDAVHEMLSQHTANIHRSVHFLSDEATDAYEGTRDIVAAFINAEPNEIVFLRNTTEALNLIANNFDRKGRRVISSYAEHHSNYLPWTDEVYRLSLNAAGQIDLQELQRELEKNDVGLISLSQISNVTGNIVDIKAVSVLAHQYGAKVLVDAAQSAPHLPIDVIELDCDFLAFSGHKLGAPTGVGVLFGKAELLEEMDLFLKGGSTIEKVSADGTYIPKNAPWKFEAGTPAIESVVGLSKAITFLMNIGMDEVHASFTQLSQFALQEIQNKLPAGCIVGAVDKTSGGPFSLNFKGLSPHTLARGLSDRYGICVRSGFHCAQPLHDQLCVPASLRLSFWIYNNEDEISKTVDGIVQLTDLISR